MNLKWSDILVFLKSGNLAPDRRVEKTLKQWKSVLTDFQFKITRLKGTEQAHSGNLCESFTPGKYKCVCCDQMLFDSSLKFDSGTGWPSFGQPVKRNAIKYVEDCSLHRKRIEILCNVCDSHLGHVFPDGPSPSGLRYCVNSASVVHDDG